MLWLLDCYVCCERVAVWLGLGSYCFSVGQVVINLLCQLVGMEKASSSCPRAEIADQWCELIVPCFPSLLFLN